MEKAIYMLLLITTVILFIMPKVLSPAVWSSERTSPR